MDKEREEEWRRRNTEEASRNEAERQKIIRQQNKENFGSGEKAILALVVIIVLGIILGSS